MKKLVALFMMILMILNICACKRMPEDTDGVSLPAASGEEKTEDNGTGALSPTPPKAQEKPDSEDSRDKETQTSKKTQEDLVEKTEDKASTDTPDTDQPNGNNAEPQEETDPQPEQDIPQTNVKGGPDTWVTITEEKAPPCVATIDYDFEPGEVMVMLMREQSAARQEYTAEDFPGVDVKEICVSYNYYPDTNNRMVLLLKLNKKDKQSVLDAMKILEQNPIVYAAQPDWIGNIIY